MLFGFIEADVFSNFLLIGKMFRPSTVSSEFILSISDVIDNPEVFGM